MKNVKWFYLAGLLLCSFSAQATAPRITAKMFGEERHADIVTYQSASSEAQTERALDVQIVTEAFKAAGKSPQVDILPSRQLATYALFNHDAVALIGAAEDLSAKDRKHYAVETFYPGSTGNTVLIVLHGSDLHQAFIDGMQRILKNGTYFKIIEQSGAKLPADYVRRLKYLNPDWQ